MQHVEIPDGHNAAKEIFQAMEDTKVSAFKDLVTDIANSYGVVTGLGIQVNGAQLSVSAGVGYTSAGDRIAVVGTTVLGTLPTTSFTDGKLVLLEIDDMKVDDTSISIHPITHTPVKYVYSQTNNYVAWDADTHFVTTDTYDGYDKTRYIVVGVIALCENTVFTIAPTTYSMYKTYRTSHTLKVGQQIVTNANIATNAGIEESKILFGTGTVDDTNPVGHTHTGGAGKGLQLSYNNLLHKPTFLLMSSVTEIVKDITTNGIVSSIGKESTTLQCSNSIDTNKQIAVSPILSTDAVYINGVRIVTGGIDLEIKETADVDTLYYVVCILDTQSTGDIKASVHIQTAYPVDTSCTLAKGYYNTVLRKFYKTSDYQQGSEDLIDLRKFGTISSKQIQDLTVGSNDITNDAVTADKIIDDAITDSKIAKNNKSIYPLHKAGIICGSNDSITADLDNSTVNGEYQNNMGNNTLQCTINSALTCITVGDDTNGDYLYIGGNVVEPVNIIFPNKVNNVARTISFVGNNTGTGIYFIYIDNTGTATKSTTKPNIRTNLLLCSVSFNVTQSDLTLLEDWRVFGTIGREQLGSNVVVVTGTIAHGGTVVPPAGFVIGQCKVMVSSNYSHTRSDDTEDRDQFIRCSINDNFLVSAWAETSGMADYYGTANFILIGVR